MASAEATARCKHLPCRVLSRAHPAEWPGRLTGEHCNKQGNDIMKEYQRVCKSIRRVKHAAYPRTELAARLPISRPPLHLSLQPLLNHSIR